MSRAASGTGVFPRLSFTLPGRPVAVFPKIKSFGREDGGPGKGWITFFKRCPVFPRGCLSLSLCEQRRPVAVLIQNNRKGDVPKGASPFRVLEKGRGNVFLEKRVGEVSRGMFWASASGKALEKSVWGQGFGSDFRKSLFGKVYKGNLPGMLLGPRFKKSHRKSALERGSRDLLRESASEKCLGDAVRGRFSEGHREKRFGSVFREDFQKMF